MKQTKSKLEKIIREARHELADLEAADARAANEKLVGRCFAYRNCCSCPSGPEDYWTLYARVERLDEDGGLVTTTFQTDRTGRFDLNPSERSSVIVSGSREIPAAVFAQQAARAVEYVRGLLLPKE